MNASGQFKGGNSRKVNRRTFLRVAGAAGLLGAASNVLPRMGRAAPKDIEVAFIQPRSGPMVPISTPAVICADIALEEINASGGIRALGGAKLKLIEYDNQGKPDVGASMVERAARSDAVAIIGSQGSGVVMVQSLVAERNGIPNIVDLAAADDITARNLRYVFQVGPTLEQVVLSDLKFITSLQDPKTGKKIKTVGVMYEDTAMGQSGFNNINKHFSKFGLELATSVGYSWKSADLTAQVTKLKYANPDLVYSWGYVPDSILIVKTMQSLKFNPLGIHGGPLSGTDEFYEATKPFGEYVFYNDWWAPKGIPGAPADRGPKIIEEYKKRSGGKPVLGEGIKTLSAFYVLKQALELAGGLSRDKLRDALERVKVTGADGSALPYIIKFDSQHRVDGAFTVVGQWLKGQKLTVFPKEAAAAELVFPRPRE